MNLGEIIAKVVIIFGLIVGLLGCNMLNRSDKGYLYRYGLSDMEPSSTEDIKRLPLENIPTAAVKRPIKVYHSKQAVLLPKVKNKKEEIVATDNRQDSYRMGIIHLESEKETLIANQQELESKIKKLEKQLNERLDSVHNLRYYEVIEGDSLWSIAGKKDIYGNNYKWLEIYGANKEKIENPDRLYPGQRLLIPEINNSSSEEKTVLAK